MFGIELGAPALIFTTRRLRIIAAAALVTLQVLIFLSGNYAFFNLLAAALCLWLLDDRVLVRYLPRNLSAQITASPVPAPEPAINRLLTAGCAAIVFLLSGLELLQIFSGQALEPAQSVLAWFAPLRIVNPYGLFAVMTTERPEIVIEGSNDGQTWLEYGFAYKPGDVHRAPVFVAPHQPRLDWQLWFAALGYASDKPWLSNRMGGVNTPLPFWLSTYNVDPWFVSLVLRLLQGSRPVLMLLGKNPFPDAPPRYVRALRYRYRLSDISGLNAFGVWWQRELLGTYLPAISLGAVQ
jgi:hypothetical protein